jgi:gliding motility-associated-like protein
VELQVVCNDVLVYNGLSPNGDGLNDELTIIGLGRYPEHEITIFNRQGNVLATFTEYQNDWAGEIDGQVLPTGTYFYVIDLGDGDSKSGYIQVSR